jgi:hypothetical protein
MEIQKNNFGSRIFGFVVVLLGFLSLIQKPKVFSFLSFTPIKSYNSILNYSQKQALYVPILVFSCLSDALCCKTKKAVQKNYDGSLERFRKYVHQTIQRQRFKISYSAQKEKRASASHQ